MKHRTLYHKVCPCGQPFTTSNADAEYHNKSCSAKFRTARDGAPLHIKPSTIEQLKEFRRA